MSVLDLIVCHFGCIQILVMGKFTTYFCNREDLLHEYEADYGGGDISMHKCFCFSDY